jgi:hypothetical protein
MSNMLRVSFLAALLMGSIGAGLGSAPALAEDEARPATIEEIPGSDHGRIVLTAEAAERLGIATAEVREEPVQRWMMISGEVEAMSLEPAVATTSSSGGEAEAPVVVRVPLLDNQNQMSGQATLVLSLGKELRGANDDTDDDEDDVSGNHVGGNPAASGPAKVYVVPIGAAEGAPLLPARPIDPARPGDAQAQYYQVSQTHSDLRPGQRVFVRVPQPGSGKRQKVVPYSSIIYDLNGDTWVYENVEALKFERRRIDVEYVEGDLAVLTEGPETGAKIVTSGAVELLGIEENIGN